MSVKVDAKDFAAAVAHAQRAVGPRPAIVEYGALPISAADGELTIDGYDGHAQARAIIDAQGELPTVHPFGATLSRIAGRLTGEVTLTEEGASLVLTSRGRRYAVGMLPDGHYPLVPHMPPAVGDAPGFADALRYVIESAGRDETVPALVGVRLVAADGRLTMQATNRYELSRAVIPWDGLDFDAFVHARSLGDFHRTMSGAMVTLRCDDTHFGLSAGNLSASFPISEGGFNPAATVKMVDDARQAALSDDGGVLIARREVLLEAIKDVEPVLDNNDPVTFHLDPEGVQLSARGSQSDGRGAVPLPCDYIGPPMDVKIKFLGALTRVPTPYVVLGFVSPIKAVHVVGQRSEDPEDLDLAVQHIAMPLRGNS